MSDACWYVLIAHFLYATYIFTCWLSPLQNRVPVVTIDLVGDINLSKAPRVKSTSLINPDRPNLIQCYAPSDLRFLGEVPVTSVDDVKETIEKARQVQKIWVKTSFKERRRVLECMKRAILKHADDIALISSIDTGKSRVDAQFGEILSSLGKLEWVSEEGEKILQPETRATNFMTYTMAKTARLEYVPVGVIGVIAPWNYPCYNMFNHIASGLFAGNAVVIKMSEYSAWSGERYIKLAKACLVACGHDPNLVQIVQGFADAGGAIVNYTDKVIFTGSPGVGKAVMKGASSTLTPLVLELGGKDPIIFAEDVDVANAVTVTMRGVFQNAGQNCVGIERVLVAESIYDEFVDKAQKAVAAIRPGSPYSVDPVTGRPSFATGIDVGCITLPSQLQLIQNLVDDAVAKGARLLVGGKILFAGEGVASAEGPAKGLFYAPTLLVDVTKDMRIAKEEVFGPVVLVFKVANDDDDIAVDIANSTVYGLGASVFSKNSKRAEAIASRLRCGMVGVNSFGLNYLVQSLPFGGVGESGFDRFSGPEGLRSCCNAKSIVSDKFSLFPVVMSVPAPLQYPIAPYASTFTSGLLGMIFESSPIDKLTSLIRLITAPLASSKKEDSNAKKSE